MITRGTKECTQASSYAYNALAPTEKKELRGKYSKHMQPLPAKNIGKLLIKYSETLTPFVAFLSLSTVYSKKRFIFNTLNSLYLYSCMMSGYRERQNCSLNS